MNTIRHVFRRIRSIAFPFLGVSATFYFVYHVFHGDRGLMAWAQIRDEVSAAKSAAEAVREDRKYLENRVRLLHPGSLDPDMLEERARLMLNYGHNDEIVILEPRKVHLSNLGPDAAEPKSPERSAP